MKEENKMNFNHMKKERYSRTTILDRFDSGWATIIYSNGIAKRIYKLDTSKDLFVLKVLNFSTKDRDCKYQEEQAKKEFDLATKAYKKLKKYVAKPIICMRAIEHAGGIVAIESLYEYGGENLNEALREASTLKIVDVMCQVIDAMIILHENNIFHSDLKPTNIVYKEGKPKIIDFGVSMDFASGTLLNGTTSGSRIIGFTEAYCPPELIRRQQYVRSKVDVYSWGMTLYQLISRKSNAEIIEEMELKRTDRGYMMFLDKVGAIKLRDDKTGIVTKNLASKLFKVFKLDYKQRPTFAKLKELFEMDRGILGINLSKETSSIKTDESPTWSEESKSPKEIERTSFSNLEEIDKLFNELRVSVSCKVYEEVQKAFDGMYVNKFDKVYLYHLCIGNTGAMIIAQGMLLWSNLTVLQLAFCNIGVPGARALSKGLEQNLKLKELYLGDHNPKFINFDYDYNEDDSNDSNTLELEGTKAICHGLRDAHSLEVLDLSNCNVNSYAVGFIEKLANEVKSLKLLYLDNNPGIIKSKCRFRSGLNVNFDTV